MYNSSLTLLFPAIASSDGGWPELPALQMLLSKGERQPLQEGYDTTVCAHFGLHAAGVSELPLAALGAMGDGLAAESGWWLCADPVHLVADRDQLFLSASDALAISQDEADALLVELNRLYADDGWQFFAASPQRWYLRLPQPLVMHTTPTREAMGRRLGEVLPRGEDALTWQRVMTEVQMLLHSSQVNAARAEQGQLVVNGIWFWGGGRLPDNRAKTEWQQVVSDHPSARGLAQIHGLPIQSVASAALTAAKAKTLWILDDTPQEAEWLEKRYFEPLLSMLRAGQLSQLVIELPGQGCWQLNRACLRRWWRRRKSLANLLKGS